MTDDQIEQRRKELARLQVKLHQAMAQAQRLGMRNYVELLQQMIEPLALLQARGGRFY